jgi:hypothetical protein
MDPLTAMPPTDAVDLVNILAGRAGLASRLGYIDWCTNVGTGQVRTIIPFRGAAASGSGDRLFACTSEGIYTCTSRSTSPTLTYTFPVQNGDSGWGVAHSMATSGGQFILYCDEANGYALYTASTDTWAAVAQGSSAGQISGVDPTALAFVTVWKNRVIFVQRGTGTMWYLPVGQLTGTVAAYYMGNKFRGGGALKGLWSWTGDGGYGIDDHLVAVSESGDIIVYQGTDPATAGEFVPRGNWCLDAVPKGRRIGTDFGGELLLLSLQGVVPISRLTRGTIGPDLYTTRKIQPLFHEYASARRTDLGWALHLDPESNALLVNMPQVGQTYEQFAMSLATGAWSRFTGVPSLCAAPWKGRLYFGTKDGRVCRVEGDLDDVDITTGAGSNITWSGITAFQAMGSARRKQIQQIRPRMWRQGSTPGYVVQARYDFDTDAATAAPAPAADVARWDSAVWGTSTWPETDNPCGGWRGATGSGAYAAIAFAGQSDARITLVGFDVKWTEGAA